MTYIPLTPIAYTDMISFQKEAFNFHKVATRLVACGYQSTWLGKAQKNTAWEGTDFLAMRFDKTHVIKVQLRSRMTIDKKYIGKEIYIAFHHGDDCYLFPHDEIMELVLVHTGVGTTDSWRDKGKYSWLQPSGWALEILAPYKIDRVGR